MAMKTDPFSTVRSATRKAFQRVGRVAQAETDPDMRMYSTLKPEHFTELMRVYGEGPIIDYIKSMESMKLMKGRK